jgi:PAS domain S-box-containing protein
MMENSDLTMSMHLDNNYYFLFENIRDAVMILDYNQICMCNLSAANMLGYERNELTGKKLEDISFPFQSKESETSEKLKSFFDQAIEDDSISFEWSFLRKNGTMLESRLLLSYDHKNDCFQSIITELQDSNTLALKNDGYLADLILNIYPGLFFIYDISEGIQKARLLRFNKKWYSEKLGFGPEDVPPGYPEFFFSPDGTDKLSEVIQELNRYKYSDFEMETRHKEGYDIPYLYVANIFESENCTYFVGFGIDISERKYVESALKQSEQYFKNIFNTSTDGILVMDLDYKLLNANSAIFNMFGYKFEEIAFQNMLDFLPPPVRPVLQSRTTLLLKREVLPPFELEITKENGEIIPVEINSIIIKYGEREGLLTTIRDLTERRMYEKKIFNSEIYSEEKERERFAKELHDGLGPILSTCKIYLHSLNEMLEGNNEMLKISERALTLLDDALGSIKEISNNLSPHVLRNFGLVHAVISFTHNIESLSGLKFEVHYNYEKRLAEVVEFTVYRILTELINNTLKYAEATLIKIEIYLNGPILNVTYSDNGKGFDFEDVKKQNKGFGLINIENRVTKFNGSFSYTTAPSSGVKVEFSLNSNHSA